MSNLRLKLTLMRQHLNEFISNISSHLSLNKKNESYHDYSLFGVSDNRNNQQKKTVEPKDNGLVNTINRGTRR